MLYLMAMLFLSLALAHGAALGAIFWRHAIPRAPGVFHTALLLPMIACMASLAALFLVALSDMDSVWGLPALWWLFVFLAAENLVWWTLNLYAIYYFLFMRPSNPGGD